MRREEVKAIFDQQAAGYDRQWAKMAPIRDGLHYLAGAVLADLPATARVLCVGAGTGEELAYLASRFPSWRFTAVDPSGAMLDVCRRKAEQQGFRARCHFHEGYVESLPGEDEFDAATCFLVSQFISDLKARAEFFRAIAARLRPGGILISSDLASDVGSKEYEALLQVWFNVMAEGGISAEGLERMRQAYATDVAVVPPRQVASILQAGGFDEPVAFYQAGLIHAWFAKRTGDPIGGDHFRASEVDGS